MRMTVVAAARSLVGVVYRGTDYPGLYGQYIFADFCRSELRSLRGEPTDLEHTVFGVQGGSLSSPSAFGEDMRGELYVASLRSGIIYQIMTDEVPNTPVPVDTPLATDTPANPPTNTPLPTSTPTHTPLPSNTPETTPEGTPETTPEGTAETTPESTPENTATAISTPLPTPTGEGGTAGIPATLTVDNNVGPAESDFTFNAENLKPSTRGTIFVNGVEVGKSNNHG